MLYCYDRSGTRVPLPITSIEKNAFVITVQYHTYAQYRTSSYEVFF